MRNHVILVRAALLIALSNYQVCQAQTVSDADKPRVYAAASIASFDALAERCAGEGGFDAGQRAEVERWTREQSVDTLRAHLLGSGLPPELKALAREGAAQVVQQMRKDITWCQAAVAMTRIPNTKFADKLPELMTGAAPAAAAAATRPARPPVTPAAPPRDATAGIAANTPGTAHGSVARIAADIEGFGFDSCTRVGYGGMVMYVPCPVVLFKNGGALTDVEGLSFPAGLTAHRAAHPRKWTQWRRQGERVQLMKTDGWENITYTAVYSTLPANFRLEGRYRSMSGGGNTAMGGGQAVAAWSDYLFSADGTVGRDGGVGASSTGAGVDVTTSSTAASRTGRYRIDGLVLAIDYADGASERRVIIADPKDNGRGTMWLDGQGYVYSK